MFARIIFYDDNISSLTFFNGGFVMKVAWLVGLVLMVVCAVVGCVSVPQYLPIKGNVSRNGKKIYHLPTCSSYKLTAVDSDRGEQYFMTENEARVAGFVKARNCRQW
ncbi:hypothetical protein HY932_01485 [Candidatus Falkowbacteria bacterium]|nr:hypothetical protein [Candidatus Falkowbacteria bacterium]